MGWKPDLSREWWNWIGYLTFGVCVIAAVVWPLAWFQQWREKPKQKNGIPLKEIFPKIAEAFQTMIRDGDDGSFINIGTLTKEPNGISFAWEKREDRKSTRLNSSH